MQTKLFYISILILCASLLGACSTSDQIATLHKDSSNKINDDGSITQPDDENSNSNNSNNDDSNNDNSNSNGNSQPPSTSDLTGGSGGVTGSKKEVKYGKSKYLVIAPEDISKEKSYGLLVYMHGDNAADYNGSRFEKSAQVSATIADKLGYGKNLMAISVHSPSSDNRWWYYDEENAAYLHDLLQNEIYKKYNIDTRHVYFTGTSGGSQMMMRRFVRDYGANYRGGAIPTCGGGTVSNKAAFNPSQEWMNSFKIYFRTTSGDSRFINQAKESATFFEQKGFNVTRDFNGSGDHCNFAEGQHGVVEKALTQMMK